MAAPYPTVIDSYAGRRANAYYAFARAFEAPGRWHNDLPGVLETSLSAFDPPLPDMGRGLADQVRTLLPHREEVAVAHARLFLGPFEIQVAPWASFYLEEEPRLMGPVSQYAAAAYAAAGLAPGDNLRDAPDHVTHELEFMYFLAFSEATTSEEIWSEHQRRFWREHLGRWLPRFSAAVANADPPLFYKTLAEALEAFCALERLELEPAA